ESAPPFAQSNGPALTLALASLITLPSSSTKPEGTASTPPTSTEPMMIAEPAAATSRRPRVLRARPAPQKPCTLTPFLFDCSIGPANAHRAPPQRGPDDFPVPSDRRPARSSPGPERTSLGMPTPWGAQRAVRRSDTSAGASRRPPARFQIAADHRCPDRQ